MKYTVANSDRICNVAFVQQLCVSKYITDSDIQLMKIVLWCLSVLITVEPIKSVLLRPVTRKQDPPFLVPPGPNISKYLDPPVIYFNFAKIFGPLGTKISEIFGPS